MSKNKLIRRVLASLFFKKAASRAAGYAKNPRSLSQLLFDAVRKSGGVSGENAATFRTQLITVVRMIRAYMSGQYRQLPRKTLLRVIAVLAYFVSPLDFIPDILPFLGLTDDIALMFWLFNGINHDLDAFRAWEATNGTAPVQPSPDPRRPGVIRIG